MKNIKNLKKDIERIQAIFGIDSILLKRIDANNIEQYYFDSEPGYRKFHSEEGAIHMALSYSFSYEKEGLYEQPRIVERIIEETDSRSVLELGSGKGFNSIYLARRHPGVNFTGIDLTEKHIDVAVKAAHGLDNLKFVRGDFSNLPFSDDQFDLIFEVESICHSDNMEGLLENCNRTLKPNGKMVVFDGFQKRSLREVGKDLELASKLVEKAMYISESFYIYSWVELAKEKGLGLESLNDLSCQVLPNLLRFQKMARHFFRFPVIARIARKRFPDNLVKNAVAGLFMPYTVMSGIHGYFMVVLSKG